MHPFPVDDDGFIRTDTAVALGFSDLQLRRAVGQGELIRVGAATYCHVAERTPEALHRLEVLGSTTSPMMAISHSSAAVLHGIEMLNADLSRLHLTSGASEKGYKRKLRHVHPGPLGRGDVTLVDGKWTTTVERTAFDVARTSPAGFPGALAVLDSALRQGADPALLTDFGAQPRTGVGVAREALQYASPLSENPGESWGRAQIIKAQLPIPRLQHNIYDSRGNFVARSDYDWVDGCGNIRVVGEFDGIGKYLKYLRPGESPVDVIRREKEREGRLQDLGIVVVRWTWADLKAGRVVPRLVAQLSACHIPQTQQKQSSPAPEWRWG